MNARLSLKGRTATKFASLMIFSRTQYLCPKICSRFTKEECKKCLLCPPGTPPARPRTRTCRRTPACPRPPGTRRLRPLANVGLTWLVSWWKDHEKKNNIHSAVLVDAISFFFGLGRSRAHGPGPAAAHPQRAPQQQFHSGGDHFFQGPGRKRKQEQRRSGRGGRSRVAATAERRQQQQQPAEEARQLVRAREERPPDGEQRTREAEDARAQRRVPGKVVVQVRAVQQCSLPSPHLYWAPETLTYKIFSV